ncbi:MAG: heparan-alpha-glucosaminide N-acetyltransferase domain-containing protein [Acidobacteriota bacterium]
MRRLLFIDMFRGFAVLVMIEGHVFNSTIIPALHATRRLHHLDTLHGMIAPSFIFISGFAFALGLERKWESFLRFEKPFWLQIWRLLFVLALGYWLHLPTWSFQELLHAGPDKILWFLRCDILQLIALSLLFSLLLCVLLRNHKAVIFTLLALVFVIIFVTPFLYFTDPREYLPVPLSDYINTKYRALFPLFPWAAYSFAGSVVCWIYLRAREAGKDGRLFWAMAILGFLFFVGAFLLFYTPWEYYKYVDPSRSSPRHFMMRIGFIFLILSALWFYEQKENRNARF